MVDVSVVSRQRGGGGGGNMGRGEGGKLIRPPARGYSAGGTFHRRDDGAAEKYEPNGTFRPAAQLTRAQGRAAPHALCCEHCTRFVLSGEKNARRPKATAKAGPRRSGTSARKAPRTLRYRRRNFRARKCRKTGGRGGRPPVIVRVARAR